MTSSTCLFSSLDLIFKISETKFSCSFDEKEINHHKRQKLTPHLFFIFKMIECVLSEFLKIIFSVGMSDRNAR